MIQLLLSILSKTSTPLIACQFLLICNPLRTLIIIITTLFKNTWILKFKTQLHLRFLLPSIISADLLGNRSLLQTAQKVWFVIGGFQSVLCVSLFVASDRNYDWQQQKMHLWRQLLNFRVCVLLKSAVVCTIMSMQRKDYMLFTKGKFHLDSSKLS